MLNLVASISEKLGRLHPAAALSAKPYLRRSNRIRSVYSSLRIESGSLGREQVRDIIDGKPVLGTEREIREVKNAYAAYALIPELDPCSIEQLKTTHAVMTRGLVPDSGRFRSGEEGVFSGDRCIFMAPPARLVPGQMEALFGWLRTTDVSPLIAAAVFHYEFVFIHPFSDGNGRMARLWHTLILARWKPVFEFMPLESRVEAFQENYYSAIAECRAAGNSNAFVEFMLEQTDAALVEYLRQTSLPEENVSPYVQRLLSVMDAEYSYAASDLLLLLGIKSKELLRRLYLNPALDAGLVAMTLPDKRKSKNQRYVRTGM